jgi:hypothetical protein
MFGAFVVMAAMAFFFAGLMAIQLVYVVLLKIFNPKASWKRCFKKAGW